MMENEALLAASRVVDRAANEADWVRLERAAEVSPSVWEELGRMMQDDSRIRNGMRRRMTTLASVPAPRVALGRRSAVQKAWISGVAAIALLVLAYVMGRSGRSLAAPEALLDEYLERGAVLGRVLEELPNQTLEIRESPSGGGLEVIYVRRILERAPVREAWRLGSNEHGEPSAAPLSLRTLGSASSF